jgi:hypothetical protein
MQLYTPIIVSLSLVAVVGLVQPVGAADVMESGADPGRSAFEAVEPAVGDAVGQDPITLARSLYGVATPTEGHYTETVEELASKSEARIILITQVGLADDSVRGMRHRLEFEGQSGAWALVWVGRQVRCWPGRGHEEWGTDPCL